MKALSVLGHLIYHMAKRKLSLQGLELKGHYSVWAFEPDYKSTVQFVVECNNKHQLTDVQIEEETIMLKTVFSQYIEEIKNNE